MLKGLQKVAFQSKRKTVIAYHSLDDALLIIFKMKFTGATYGIAALSHGQCHPFQVRHCE